MYKRRSFKELMDAAFESACLIINKKVKAKQKYLKRVRNSKRLRR